MPSCIESCVATITCTRVYCCPKCQGDEFVAARVAETVPDSIAAPGLMAEVAASKGTDHLPFNRQSAIYGRGGVNLSPSTLSDLFAQTAGILAPLYYFMHQQLLKSKVICTDDTPVKVQGRNKEKNSSMNEKVVSDTLPFPVLVERVNPPENSNTFAIVWVRDHGPYETKKNKNGTYSNKVIYPTRPHHSHIIDLTLPVFKYFGIPSTAGVFPVTVTILKQVD